MGSRGHSIQENIRQRNDERLKKIIMNWLAEQEVQAKSTLAKFQGLPEPLRSHPDVIANRVNWEGVMLGIAYLRNNLKTADPNSKTSKGFA